MSALKIAINEFAHDWLKQKNLLQTTAAVYLGKFVAVARLALESLFVIPFRPPPQPTAEVLFAGYGT